MPVFKDLFTREHCLNQLTVCRKDSIFLGKTLKRNVKMSWCTGTTESEAIIRGMLFWCLIKFKFSQWKCSSIDNIILNKLRTVNTGEEVFFTSVLLPFPLNWQERFSTWVISYFVSRLLFLPTLLFFYFVSTSFLKMAMLVLDGDWSVLWVTAGI